MVTTRMWQAQKHGETEAGKDVSVEMEGYMLQGKQHQNKTRATDS